MNERKRFSIINRPCLNWTGYCECEIYLRLHLALKLKIYYSEGIAQPNEVHVTSLKERKMKTKGRYKKTEELNLMFVDSPAQLAPLDHTPFTTNPIHSFKDWAKSKQMLQCVLAGQSETVIPAEHGRPANAAWPHWR